MHHFCTIADWVQCSFRLRRSRVENWDSPSVKINGFVINCVQTNVFRNAITEHKSPVETLKTISNKNRASRRWTQIWLLLPVFPIPTKIWKFLITHSWISSRTWLRFTLSLYYRPAFTIAPRTCNANRMPTGCRRQISQFPPRSCSTMWIIEPAFTL